MAMRHYPDKGGNEARFREIYRAYVILSDAEMRRVYDRDGEEGIEQAAMGGNWADRFTRLASWAEEEDIFSMFFGGAAAIWCTEPARLQQ
mmetsp:Transcript_18871/g.44982  ORF Transcript_18871/g.44982 Transcript_18871/m.44982 type:complete len:90 (-) Transcript_18871:154-423(-)